VSIPSPSLQPQILEPVNPTTLTPHGSKPVGHRLTYLVVKQGGNMLRPRSRRHTPRLQIPQIPYLSSGTDSPSVGILGLPTPGPWFRSEQRRTKEADDSEWSESGLLRLAANGGLCGSKPERQQTPPLPAQIVAESEVVTTTSATSQVPRVGLFPRQQPSSTALQTGSLPYTTHATQHGDGQVHLSQ
jgi:hypothetical protein